MIGIAAVVGGSPGPGMEEAGGFCRSLFFFGHSFFGELFDGFIGEMGIVVPRWRILTAYGELTTLCFWQLSRSSFRIEAVARGWAIR